jgi:hypothetical protein
VPLSIIPVVNNQLDGNLGVAVTTSPTFTYKTTKVSLSGANPAITTSGGSAKVASADEDYLETLADVQGEITFKGVMEVAPEVTITRVASVSGLNLQIPIDVAGYKTPYTSNTPANVVFPRTTVHIPLPNLFVPKDEVAFGAVQMGSQTEKHVELKNTGELGSVMSFESSDPQFTFTTSQASTGPKSSYDLVVRFSPSGPGDASRSSRTIPIRLRNPSR